MKPNSQIEWLLQYNQPAVKYHTLIDLLDRTPSDSEVKETYAKIPKRGWAASILQQQDPKGTWASGLYQPKYLATNWQLLVLSDLGLTTETPAVKKACELYLAEVSGSKGCLGGSDSETCITGNLARMMIRLGYLEDPRISEAIIWLVEAQKEDGGWHCFESNHGTLDCWEALAAFNALPRSRWTRSIKRSVERGAEFYLERELYKEGKKRYEPWFRFHYPWHYYYDLLVGLDVLTSLGYTDDRRMKSAIQVLKEKQQPEGTWTTDIAHPDLGMGADYSLKSPAKPLILEEPGTPSKWITFLALRVLKRSEN
jgi:hypothetical protein